MCVYIYLSLSIYIYIYIERERERALHGELRSIHRDSLGHSYLPVRGEIIGFVEDGLLRKHSPRMCSFLHRGVVAVASKGKASPEKTKGV